MNTNNDIALSHNSRIRRKKDPKSMTIEELEDYIKRNRPTGRLGQECKSLNSSFQSLTAFNFYDANNNNTDKKRDKSEEKDRTIISTHSLLNRTETNDVTEGKMLNSNSILKELVSPYNVNLVKTSKHNTIEDSNDDIKSTPSKKQSMQPIGQQQLNNNPISTISSNSITNLNSKAASGYLKTLQDKINQLTSENEELKRNFISVSELLEKEKTNGKASKELYHDNTLNNTLNKSNDFIQQKEELILKINMQATNIALLEKEKSRHLEQNALEKEEYEVTIQKLNNKIQMITKENETLKHELKKYKEINDEFNQFKGQFDSERNEMIETMKSLREIVFQKENEKNSMIKQYEEIIQELNEKINIMACNTSQYNQIPQMDNNCSFTSVKKNKSGTASNNNVKPRNKTKDKNTGITTKSTNNTNTNKQVNYGTSTSSYTSCVSTTTTTGNKKGKRPKTPNKEKKTTKIQKTSIPIKSLTNHIQQQQHQQQQYQNDYQNPNMLIIPGDINSIRSDYSDNNPNNNNPYNCHIWQSQREDKINGYEEQLNQINEHIFTLERNLPEITRDYKNILSRLNSNLFPEEVLSLKNNLNMLGTTIEEHNSQLSQLKAQQQDILKDYLAQRDSNI